MPCFLIPALSSRIPPPLMFSVASQKSFPACLCMGTWAEALFFNDFAVSFLLPALLSCLAICLLLDLFCLLKFILAKLLSPLLVFLFLLVLVKIWLSYVRLRDLKILMIDDY